MKSYVHDQVGNNTEAFASRVKDLAANTSELFTHQLPPYPLRRARYFCRSSVNMEFVA